MNLKQQAKSLKDSKNIVSKGVYLVLKQTSHLAKLLVDGAYRSVYIAEWKFGSQYFQRSFFTLPNRYPILFDECRRFLSNVKTPHILSFGCATGEEVFSLSEYLPNAEIMGVDINEWCLKQCKKKNHNPKCSFYHRLSAYFIASDTFDAIFCMAVFQRLENRADNNAVARGLSFEQFEADVSMLHQKLKPGGLFIIDNADFSFTDTVCSKNYSPLNFEGNLIGRRGRPLFDRDNKKVADTQMLIRMFVKNDPEPGG